MSSLSARGRRIFAFAGVSLLATLFISQYLIELGPYLVSPTFRVSRSHVILVEVPRGFKRDDLVGRWDEFAKSKGTNETVEVHILCHEASHEASRDDPQKATYGSMPFVALLEETWDVALRRLRTITAPEALIGLSAAGTLPNPVMLHAFDAFDEALREHYETPIAIVSRARQGEDGMWFSDMLVAQVWLNAAMLDLLLQGGSKLGSVQVREMGMIGVISLLLERWGTQGGGGKQPNGIIVDGTDFLRTTAIDTAHERWCKEAIAWRGMVSTGVLGCRPLDREIAAALGSYSTTSAANISARNVGFYVSDLPYAVVPNVDEPGELGSRHRFGRPVWPPSYVLETASSTEGLVAVTSINCGYLDMATNFFISIQKHAELRVLVVATDEVAFEFLDDIIPGYVILFPSSDRQHATEAGEFGNMAFKSQVVLRPDVMTAILDRGYAVLWTDVDMVWRGNPLPLLPPVGHPNSPDVVLQRDRTKACTCFVFMRSTLYSRRLVKQWKNEILRLKSKVNQHPFQRPFVEHRDGGWVKVEMLPIELMPAGKEYFATNKSDDKVLVVHNNWIRGHDSKMERWISRDMWYVGGLSFPTCVDESGDKR